jgi:hypothetical protein
MPHVSKKRRAGQSVYAKTRYMAKTKRIWDDRLEEFRNGELGNPKGRKRTTEENKCILNSVKMMLSYQLKLVEEKKLSIFDIS